MKICLCISLATASLATGLARGGEVLTLYQNSFETTNSIGSEWTSAYSRSRSADLSWFLGRHGAQTVSLRLATTPPPEPQGSSGLDLLGQSTGSISTILPLPDEGAAGSGSIFPTGNLDVPNVSFTLDTPAAPVVYSVIFDLYIIDSWDANTDSFAVAVNGTTLFDEFFSNFHLDTNFRMPDVGPTDMGFNTWADTIYRNIRLDFQLDPSVDFMDIDFIGRTDQTLADESWGIDNVRVLSHDGTLAFASVPAPGAAITLVLGCSGLLRRRR